MARLGINTGAAANDGTGDTLRVAAGKINDNFLEVYSYLGAGSTTTLSAPVWSTTSVGINTLRNVGIGTTNPRFALEVGAVGASGTTLFVNGDARITGILSIGTSSITLNGSTNIINVGTGITLDGSTGIISATSIVLGGTTLTGAAVTSIVAGTGITISGSTGQVTINATGAGSSQFVVTSIGIHTLSNIGIGTTNPTSKLTVTGDGTFTGVVTASLFSGSGIGLTGIPAGQLTGALPALDGSALIGVVGSGSGIVIKDSGTTVGTAGTIDFGDNLTVSPISAGIVTVTASSGSGSSQFVTTAAGIHTLSNVGIGTTNPTSKLTVGAVGAATTNLVVNGWANISGMNIVQDTDTNSIYIGYEAGQSLLTQANDNGNIALGYRSLYGSTSPDYCIAIGYEALRNPTSNTDHTIAIGHQAGYNGGGGSNVFIGHEAGQNATTGHSNVAIGYEAAGGGDPHDGVYIGYDAGRNVDGNGNVFVGHGAGKDVTSGAYNTFIGRIAGNDMTTGDDNVIIGGYQGNEKGLDIRTSSNNIVLSDGDGNIRFYANSSGNVGLGTTNPTSALTVVGSGTSTSQLFVSGVSTLSGNINSGGDIILGTTASSDKALILGGTSQTGSLKYNSSSNRNQFSGTNTDFYIRAKNYTVQTGPSGFTPETALTITEDGSVALYYDDSKKFETTGAGVTITGTTFTNQLNVSGVSTVGVVTGATYFGDASRIVSGRWTLGANGSNDYTFTGIGFTETTNDPTLYLARGAVYEFVNNMGAHPFQIQSSSGSGGTVYNTGITSNTVSNGTLRFEVPFNAPNTLYYQCTAHAAMGGTIIIYPSV